VFVHLIDGTYELFRNYFAVPSALAPDGREVGAVRGVLASLAAMLREPEVTHVAVAFDTVIESFRNELFAGYKTGEGMDPVLHQQFELVERAVRALGIPVWSMVEFEADDALASGAVRYGADPRVERVLLCTPDKDLAQMVRGERIVGFDRRKRAVLDEPGVVRSSALAPRRSRTCWPSLATSRMAFRGCRSGVRSPRPWCWHTTSTSKRSPTMQRRGPWSCAQQPASLLPCVKRAATRCSTAVWRRCARMCRWRKTSTRCAGAVPPQNCQHCAPRSASNGCSNDCRHRVRLDGHGGGGPGCGTMPWNLLRWVPIPFA
jgi:hypothetical protein